MQTLNTIEEARAWAAEQQQAGQRIGLVPTMGALHEGHLSLITQAAGTSDRVVVSIFVNPTQFGPGEDLAAYPRNFERDEALCRKAGADAIFYPTPEMMYASDHSVFVAEEALSQSLCGASRPGHFRGVLTVVAKLFNILSPNVAVFGEKDAQQFRLIRRMQRDLNFDIELIGAPIVREVDGLAMSSRNRYLSETERQDALCLQQGIQHARRLFEAGEREPAALLRAVRKHIEPVASARIDYLELVDEVTLEPLDETLQRPALLALAVYLGDQARLLDNTVLTP